MGELEQGRRGGDVFVDRRLGPSRLSRWHGRHVLIASIAWLGGVLLIVTLGTFASIAEAHGLTEARIAFSRSNIIGLLAVLVIPPAWLTLEWRLMRGRRRERVSDRRRLD